MKKEIKLSATGAYFILIIIGALLVPLFALLSALIAARLRDPSGAIGIAAIVSLLLSALVSGCISPRLRSEGWLSVALSSAVTLGVLLCVLTLLFSEGEGVGKGLIGALSYVGTFMLSAALSRRPRRRRRRRR